MPMLEISIFNAESLPSVDGFLAGKSDPYVTCGVPGQERQAIKTKTIDNNLNPTWDHTEVLHDWQIGEPIEFAVYDSNAVKADKLLGKAFLESDQFYPSGVEGTVPLEGTDIAAGTLSIRVLCLDGEAEMMSETICVDVLSAKHLADTDGFMAGKSDPYVVVEVPGKPDMKFKTHVINNNLDPIWNHRSEVVGYTPGDPLDFTVYDSNAISKDTFLGKFTLDSQSFYPNGAVGDVTLQNKDGVEGQSTLEIAIHICGAASLPPLEPASVADRAVTQTMEITPEEAVAAVAETPFEAIDTNHDGVITQQEFTAAVQAVAHAPVATAGRVTCVSGGMVPGTVSYSARPMTTGPVTYAMPPVMAAASPAPMTTYAAPPVAYAAAPAPQAVSFKSAAPVTTYAAPPVAFASAPRVVPQPAAVMQPRATPAPAPAFVSAPRTATAPAFAAAPQPMQAPVSVAKAQAFSYAAPRTAYNAAPMTYAAAPMASMQKAGAAPAMAVAAAAPMSVRAVASPSHFASAGSRVSFGAAPAPVAMPSMAAFPVGMPAVAATPSLRYQSMTAPMGSAVSFTTPTRAMQGYAVSPQPSAMRLA